jgi:hypothetical protein
MILSPRSIICRQLGPEVHITSRQVSVCLHPLAIEWWAVTGSNCGPPACKGVRKQAQTKEFFIFKEWPL